MKPLILSICRPVTLAIMISGPSGFVKAELIAGVNFEGAEPSVFDRNPDDYLPDDGITVSSGTLAPKFEGWTMMKLDGSNGANGNLRNDAGANDAGATTPNFPARLEAATVGSWSITINPDVFLNLEKIEFDVRGATEGMGRQGRFRTSLDGEDEFLWEDLNLPGRTSGNWQRIVIPLTDARYQGLTDQEVSFFWITPTGAIDLDTIEVYGSTGLGAKPLELTIVQNQVTPGTFNFSWTSQPGKFYDLVTSTSLAVPISDWSIFENYADISATDEVTTLNEISVPDVKRFFAVVEKPIPAN